MDERVLQLKTPADCERFAINVQKKFPELVQQARRRAVELRAAEHGLKSVLELELLKAVYAYEEVLSEKHKRRTRASYTWRMIDRHGIITAAERAVNRKLETKGFKELVAMGLDDLTFEAVIIKHPDKFSPEVVTRSKERLEELQKIKETKG